MKTTGQWILFAAVILAAYAFFYFNVTNEGFVNLGLMDDRRNLLIVSGFAGIIGAILMVAGKNEK